jgi:hypothetical protein
VHSGECREQWTGQTGNKIRAIAIEGFELSACASSF